MLPGRSPTGVPGARVLLEGKGPVDEDEGTGISASSIRGSLKGGAGTGVSASAVTSSSSMGSNIPELVGTGGSAAGSSIEDRLELSHVSTTTGVSPSATLAGMGPGPTS